MTFRAPSAARVVACVAQPAPTTHHGHCHCRTVCQRGQPRRTATYSAAAPRRPARPRAKPSRPHFSEFDSGPTRPNHIPGARTRAASTPPRHTLRRPRCAREPYLQRRPENGQLPVGLTLHPRGEDKGSGSCLGNCLSTYGADQWDCKRGDWSEISEACEAQSEASILDEPSYYPPGL